MTTLIAPPAALIEHLSARLETALSTHLSRAQDWYPHEYVPWGDAQDFTDVPWEASQSRLTPAVSASVTLNLLTEDNLPGYHGALSATLGGGELWKTWLDRWTAEEGRHAIALRDYLTVTRAIDPVQLENDRMATVSGGFSSGDRDGLRVITYVSMQELATRVAHRGTGKQSNDPGLDKLLARISTDENLHMVLYRDLFAAALEADPTAALTALTTEIVGFEMPGTGIPGFIRRAAIVARAGIYDLAVHREQVLTPLLRFWGIFELTDLPPAAEAKREELALVLAEIDRRVATQQAKAQAKQQARRPA